MTSTFQYSPSFISIEGIDGSGKTTLLHDVCGDLLGMGYSCVTLREPGGSKISERIRDLLLDKRSSGMSPKAELLLYNAARAQVIAEVVKPALDAGKIVLADRFAWSTLAYQGYGRQLDIDEVAALSELTCGDCFPSLTIILDISLEVQARRMRLSGRPADRMESLDREFFERVRKGYREIAFKNPESCIFVNGDVDRESLKEAVVGLICEHVRTHRNK